MADTGGELNPPKKIDAREKLRVVRERQAEERQRRLEELKKHALEAQQLREQKELERRRRMEDLKQKETEKRCQVEERKRQIWEAEKERREAIVRKNQEREARIESKRKNERSSIVFAFGSSTPRLLETTDSNSFWGPRRATSTANLRLFPTASPHVALSRRPSERELEPKKRASSAGGLYRNPGDLMSTSMYEVFHWDTEPPKPRLSLAPHTDPLLSNIDDPSSSVHGIPQTPTQSKSYYISHAVAGDSDGGSAMSASQVRSIGRRKTDLMPTIPSPRDGTSSRPTSGTRSLARTPGDTTPSRPGSVLSQCSLTSASTPTPTPRVRSAPRRPRPFSIHITGVSKEKETQKIDSPSEEKVKTKEIRATTKPSAGKPAPVKRQNYQKSDEVNKLGNNNNNNNNNNVVAMNKVNNVDGSADEKKSQAVEIKEGGASVRKEVGSVDEGSNVNTTKPGDKKAANSSTETTESQNNTTSTLVKTIQNGKKEISPSGESENSGSTEEESSKTNVMSRSKIATEEEAKAALAERRRFAREQAEREAEAERLRLEMEAQKEAERLRKEEEEQRLAEEEQLRLLEEARRIEEERLMQAIQEAKRREEEERERRQQEEMARLEKEEAERKAREEAERQRVEMAERLKREEEERQARRKRVEAIMKRTRNNPANSTNKADSEKGEEDGTEHEKDEPKNKLEVFLHGERVSSEGSLTNGQTSQEDHKQVLDSNLIDNNHSNGVDITTNNSLEKEDCLNSNSTLVTPLIAFQGKTKDTPVATNYMA